MTNKQPLIDEALVRDLITHQFPQWMGLPVHAVAQSGWDNRTFHLGANMLVRMPSSAAYASQVAKEQLWLPKLAPCLPLSIPTPLACGRPSAAYPWHWSIYSWLPGESASIAPVSDLNAFAADLAGFLRALHRVDANEGPVAGAHSFFRGGSLSQYDAQTRQALVALKGQIDIKAATELWERALTSSWQQAPVWVHGDISPGNLLVHNGRLSAVIDFGQLSVGDPACDLGIAWVCFKSESRDIFRAALPLDAETWIRGRAWVLWKFMIVAAGISAWNAPEAKNPLRVIEDILQTL